MKRKYYFNFLRDQIYRTDLFYNVTNEYASMRTFSRVRIDSIFQGRLVHKSLIRVDVI